MAVLDDLITSLDAAVKSGNISEELKTIINPRLEYYKRKNAAKDKDVNALTSSLLKDLKVWLQPGSPTVLASDVISSNSASNQQLLQSIYNEYAEKALEELSKKYNDVKKLYYAEQKKNQGNQIKVEEAKHSDSSNPYGTIYQPKMTTPSVMGGYAPSKMGGGSIAASSVMGGMQRFGMQQASQKFCVQVNEAEMIKMIGQARFDFYTTCIAQRKRLLGEATPATIDLLEKLAVTILIKVDAGLKGIVDFYAEKNKSKQLEKFFTDLKSAVDSSLSADSTINDNLQPSRIAYVKANVPFKQVGDHQSLAQLVAEILKTEYKSTTISCGQ